MTARGSARPARDGPAAAARRGRPGRPRRSGAALAARRGDAGAGGRRAGGGSASSGRRLDEAALREATLPPALSAPARCAALTALLDLRGERARSKRAAHRASSRPGPLQRDPRRRRPGRGRRRRATLGGRGLLDLQAEARRRRRRRRRSGRCARRSARGRGSASTPTAPGTWRPRSGPRRARAARDRARRAAGGDAGGGGGAGARRPRSRSPATRASRAATTPSAPRATGACAADRDQALQGGRARGGDRDRRDPPRLPLQRSRRPGRDRRRGAGRGRRCEAWPATATGRSPTASPPSASSPRRRRGRVRAARRHAAPARRPGPRGRDRRGGAGTRTASSLTWRLCTAHKATKAPRMDPTNANTALASAFAEELARCGLRHAVLSPGSRSTPLARGALAPARDRGDGDRRRALRRLLRPRRGAGERCAGGDALHLGHRRRQLPPGDLRGRPLRGPADRADRRPAAGAARDRRRPDDRPAEALRLLGALVLRGRHPRGRRRRPAPLPLDRLPRVRRGARRAAARARSTSTSPGASRWRRCPSRER